VLQSANYKTNTIQAVQKYKPWRHVLCKIAIESDVKEVQNFIRILIDLRKINWTDF